MTVSCLALYTIACLGCYQQGLNDAAAWSPCVIISYRMRVIEAMLQALATASRNHLALDRLFSANEIKSFAERSALVCHILMLIDVTAGVVLHTQ